MSYQFEKPVDPLNPLDPKKDPPPAVWKSVEEIEHERARYGKHVTCFFKACQDWEEREQKRHHEKKAA